MTERICSTENCGRAGRLTRGMCARCYRYWLDHTPPDEREVAPRFVDDFWQQVKKTHEHGCWLWRGSTDRKGYGRWKRHLAHREAWRREHGPILDGKHVLHICDQHACVNPRHLYLGTVRENAIDASVRGQVPRVNAFKTHCPLLPPWPPARPRHGEYVQDEAPHCPDHLDDRPWPCADVLDVAAVYIDHPDHEEAVRS